MRYSMNKVSKFFLSSKTAIWTIIVLLSLPFLSIAIYSSLDFPWSKLFSKDTCWSTTCIEFSAKKYLGAFSWYSSWLTTLYNITTILGVAVAVLTYYKTKQSQAISNHFSNVDLFKNYISEEISKKEWLSIASFDLMVWYLKIYPNSKLGDMNCSQEYVDLIHDLVKRLAESNSGIYNDKKTGYQFAPHQKSVKSIYRKIGISIKETNRLSFYEIEGEILDLINKVNKTFPSHQAFRRFPDRAYK